MYDPAIHLSDAEARVQYGKDVDVQAAVERPSFYGTPMFAAQTNFIRSDA